MQDAGAVTSLDEEILAEERLDEQWELMLYNMSLRQTSQRAAGGHEGTHLLVSKIEANPAYQKMIERGLLECRYHMRGGDGASASATLLVTRKGLRYCVLFADEIEPRRAYDVAGVQRFQADDAPYAGGFGYTPTASDYAAITSGVASGKSAAKEAAWALTAEQVARLEEAGAQRRGSDVSQRSGNNAFSGARERCEFVTESGDVWSYVEADGGIAQITGVATAAKTLHVPSRIGDAAVVSIAADALSENDFVEEIVCPDSVGSIGERAFRLNPKLRRLVLPGCVAEFRVSWIDRCHALEELVLPGLAPEVTRGMLAGGALRKLSIGRGARTVEPGAFQDACLDEIAIDAENPFLKTDGTAIYSKDGTELIALARPVESIAIAEGCTKLAKKCCFGFAQLREAQFPESLEEVGPFAFARSGLERFDAPALLRTIGDKAFLGCTSLSSVSLNAGLETVGESAFEGSAISGLVLPASIRHLGKSMTKGTGVVHSGPGCTLVLEAGCTNLFLDGAGGLYRVCEDGPHLMQLVDGDIEGYDVCDGAVAIDPYAFAFHDRIRSVRVPASVRTIGQSAFRICKSLVDIELPDSVHSIGDEAFLDTNLESFRVPAELAELGERALVTFGAHHGTTAPSLSRIEVAPENETFYMACGMLCRKTNAGASVVAFDGSQHRVEFPEEITRVEEYALSGARGIEHLSLNPRLASLGTNALATRCWIRHIRIELAKPLEGRLAFDFFFPDTPGAVRGIALGLGGASWVNVPGIMEQLDLCLVNARDYNAPGKRDNISAYAQAKLILDRLDDPVMLKPANRDMMERVLRNNVEDVCFDVALYDDRGVLDDLIERGFVNEGNLERVIERVGALRDAATSAYLLEAKRERFSRSVSDYDI